MIKMNLYNAFRQFIDGQLSISDMQGALETNKESTMLFMNDLEHWAWLTQHEKVIELIYELVPTFIGREDYLKALIKICAPLVAEIILMKCPATNSTYLCAARAGLFSYPRCYAPHLNAKVFKWIIKKGIHINWIRLFEYAPPALWSDMAKTQIASLDFTGGIECKKERAEHIKAIVEIIVKNDNVEALKFFESQNGICEISEDNLGPYIGAHLVNEGRLEYICNNTSDPLLFFVLTNFDFSCICGYYELIECFIKFIHEPYEFKSRAFIYKNIEKIADAIFQSSTTDFIKMWIIHYEKDNDVEYAIIMALQRFPILWDRLSYVLDHIYRQENEIFFRICKYLHDKAPKPIDLKVYTPIINKDITTWLITNGYWQKNILFGRELRSYTNYLKKWSVAFTKETFELIMKTCPNSFDIYDFGIMAFEGYDPTLIKALIDAGYTRELKTLANIILNPKQTYHPGSSRCFDYYRLVVDDICIKANIYEKTNDDWPYEYVVAQNKSAQPLSKLEDMALAGHKDIAEHCLWTQSDGTLTFKRLKIIVTILAQYDHVHCLAGLKEMGLLNDVLMRTIIVNRGDGATNKWLLTEM